jgi:hypothetical protein
MKRYFFHIVGNHGFSSRDRVGAEFRDLDEVRKEASLFASDMRVEAAAAGVSCQEHIEVTDEQGKLVFRFTCTEIEDNALEPASRL